MLRVLCLNSRQPTAIVDCSAPSQDLLDHALESRIARAPPPSCPGAHGPRGKLVRRPGGLYADRRLGGELFLSPPAVGLDRGQAPATAGRRIGTVASRNAQRIQPSGHHGYRRTVGDPRGMVALHARWQAAGGSQRNHRRPGPADHDRAGDMDLPRGRTGRRNFRSPPAGAQTRRASPCHCPSSRRAISPGSGSTATAIGRAKRFTIAR